MKLTMVTCLFVLDNQKNDNIKKNDIKTIKLVLSKKDRSLIKVSFDEKSSFKEQIRAKIREVIGDDKIHLEQVYTFGENRFYNDNMIDVVYMGLANINDIKKLNDDYELVDFNVVNNSEIVLGNEMYSYKTSRKEVSNTVEYYHNINVDDSVLEKMLLETITTFKYLRSRVDNTDVCYKLLPEVFTLEDVRIVYEMIKDVNVDKSNFRKKIIKNCEKIDMIAGDKGYRPSQMYKFNPDSIDIWL